MTGKSTNSTKRIKCQIYKANIIRLVRNHKKHLESIKSKMYINDDDVKDLSDIDALFNNIINKIKN